jgi:predicted dehydrogenase/SAM-dependent methyltransferase
MTASGKGPKKPEHNVVIVGFGYAGKIHQKAYESTADTCRLAAIVEPDLVRRQEIETSLPGVQAFKKLGDALEELGGDVIVDFCVPAIANLVLVETALEFGVNKFLIEKPLGDALVSKLGQSEAVYLDTYQASSGIQRLLSTIEEQNSNLQQLAILFHKNRVPDSSDHRGFVHGAVPSAWMIEGPHMLSICRQIAGEIEEISSATTFDMEIAGNDILLDHGGGHAILQHENGVVSHLDLSLCSDRNERIIDVRLANDVRISLALPPSKTAEQFSTLEVEHPSGKKWKLRIEDHPMEYCVQNAVRHLIGEPVAVSHLSDGLAVCAIVEKMKGRKQFWQSAPKQWKHFGPPLRPCAEDTEVMENQVTQWMGHSPTDDCNVLLCGVTPEIANMSWPKGTRLWAVEKSKAMIEEVWPANEISGKQAIQAEWTKLPFAPGSFDIVIGDGCFTSLEYPRLQQEFLKSLRNVMQDDGLLIMRFFVQTEEPERPEDIFKELLENKIGSFHAMKWRLAMSLQQTPNDGICVDDIWRTWTEAGISAPWPAHTVNTINTYKGSNHRLIFTSLAEVRDLISSSFVERACIEPQYELGDRCPILVYSPRS